MTSFVQMDLDGQPVTPTPDTKVYKKESKTSYRIELDKDGTTAFRLNLSPSVQDKLLDADSREKVRKLLKQNTKSILKPSEADLDKLEAAWDNFSQTI